MESCHASAQNSKKQFPISVKVKAWLHRVANNTPSDVGYCGHYITSSLLIYPCMVLASLLWAHPHLKAYELDAPFPNLDALFLAIHVGKSFSLL